ncbi:hypothetical protein EG68_03718 [Paragonimus skrjabini miyazakii]|uniref:Probable RNA polymerase II nuclear localization protein SLC7A6OS n=1 Tax=Paragonimus skrjabini miyazakii TaxID=59628 RepID=A0A8S9Z5I1_9TREM|nr:hypothetical protein EG68_03718 [Paragonimus skrjabini miyazakii]
MPVYLRVKRLRSETAVDSFETQRLCKISRQDAEAPSIFRYIGSQLTTTSVETCYDQITSLNRIESRGKCKLLWDAKSGKILRQNEADNIPCEVRINTLKRNAPTGYPQSADSGPMPVKLLKIIDVIPNPVSDNRLSTAIDSLSLDPPAVKSSLKDDELDCVHDLYLLERSSKQRRLSDFDSVGLSPTTVQNSFDRIVFEDDWRYSGLSDDEVCADDEDDSNSESNWRNDYPEEEGTTESDSDSSSSSSRRRRSEPSDYDDFGYTFPY